MGVALLLVEALLFLADRLGALEICPALLCLVPKFFVDDDQVFPKEG
jgi:hypothetical protein